MALLDSMGVFNKDQPTQKLEKVTVDTNKQRAPAVQEVTLIDFYRKFGLVFKYDMMYKTLFVLLFTFPDLP